ncbi:MAG: type VI secretion system tip protein VgrG [Deltaproteobacteria bacterium]|nr:type VI secretion system tip protein VgrG [Deltaproteobacteria bacterium]
MADDGAGTNGIIAEVSFVFEVQGADGPLTVARAMVRERLCAPFEGSVQVSAPTSLPLHDLIGCPCALTLHRESLTRRFTGVVTSVEDRGSNREARVFEIGFAPSLAILAHRAHHRVWQGVDALRIIREVLDDAGLYAGDALVLPEQVAGDAPAPRECCVQFGERDLDFVQRLLAEEGILFTFGDGEGADALVLFDARGGSRRPLVPAAANGPLPIQGHGAATAAAEGIHRIDATSSMTPSGVTLRDWDFTHPREPLASTRSRDARSVERYPARFVLGAYDGGGHEYASPDLRRTARIALQQEASNRDRLRGEGNVTGMSAGGRFALEEPGDRALSGEFVLTAVLHLGHCPDETLGGGDDADDRYRNLFECVPAARPWAAPTVGRPRADHPQVAVVSAEPGSDEEICTDHYGRVLVRFPWDRPEARRASQAGTRASCWLRVMQPWSGPGWGFHFTPRVGMEVIVQCIDGDPDRPYVAGCLPNAANVPPVELPAHRTQSALRTQSSPANGGYNELRFEDLADHEEVYLRAQRDQRVEVLHDRSVAVSRDARAEVGRDESLFVGRDRAIDVSGNEQHAVEGNLQWSVGGDAIHDVSGNHTVMVHKAHSSHVDQTAEVTVDERVTVAVGGNSGTSLEISPDDLKVQTPKKHLVAVGDETTHELTPERFAVKVPKGISLVCGDTRIELGEDRIVLQTKGGAKVELQGDKITIKTDGPVSIKGSNVSNNG